MRDKIEVSLCERKAAIRNQGLAPGERFSQRQSHERKQVRSVPAHRVQGQALPARGLVKSFGGRHSGSMYKKTVLFAGFLLFVFAAVHAEDGERSDSKTSYAAGVVLGLKFKEAGIKFDYRALAEGMEKTIETGDAGMSEEEALGLLQSAYSASLSRLKEKNWVKSSEFLKQNGRKSGIKTTKSGLQYEVISSGEGEKPDNESVVIVNYKGTLIDGTEFDKSGGEPALIPLAKVIPGWTEGIGLMNVGSHFRLFIPPDLAYGEDGAGDVIPPNSVLVFDVELLGIEEDKDE